MCTLLNHKKKLLFMKFNLTSAQVRGLTKLKLKHLLNWMDRPSKDQAEKGIVNK